MRHLPRIVTCLLSIPALAAAQGDLSQITRCGNPSFSPDGTQLAVICDLTGTPEVWTVRVNGGWPNPKVMLGARPQRTTARKPISICALNLQLGGS